MCTTARSETQRDQKDLITRMGGVQIQSTIVKTLQNSHPMCLFRRHNYSFNCSFYRDSCVKFSQLISLIQLWRRLLIYDDRLNRITCLFIGSETKVKLLDSNRWKRHKRTTNRAQLLGFGSVLGFRLLSQTQEPSRVTARKPVLAYERWDVYVEQASKHSISI